MSNETKPVSKEQWEEICELAGLPADSKRYNLSEVDMRRVAAYAISQQTAALREEAERQKNVSDFFMEDRQRHRELCKELALKNKKLVAELEAVKKERGRLSKLVEMARTAIEKALPKITRLDTFRIIHAEMYHFLNVVKQYRLSSGETQPASK